MKNKISNLNNFLMLASEILKTTQKGSREAFKYVYSDDEKLVVTDGSILITLDKTKEDVAPGFYNIAKLGKELTLMPSNFEGKYPDYTRVIPKYAFKALKINLTKNNYMCDLIKLQDIALKHCGGYIEEQHFELIKKSELIYQVFTPWNQCGKEERYPVIFEANALTVVVMPKPIK